MDKLGPSRKMLAFKGFLRLKHPKKTLRKHLGEKGINTPIQTALLTLSDEHPDMPWVQALVSKTQPGTTIKGNLSHTLRADALCFIQQHPDHKFEFSVNQLWVDNQKNEVPDIQNLTLFIDEGKISVLDKHVYSGIYNSFRNIKSIENNGGSSRILISLFNQNKETLESLVILESFEEFKDVLSNFQMSNLKKMTEFSIQGFIFDNDNFNNGAIDGIVVKILSTLSPTVEILKLSDNDMEGRFIKEYLTPLSNMTFKTLNLHNNKISNGGLKTLADLLPYSIENLGMSGNKIGGGKIPKNKPVYFYLGNAKKDRHRGLKKLMVTLCDKNIKFLDLSSPP